MHRLAYTESTSSSSGIVLVDKPMGCTSHDVVAWVRKMTGIRKVGHTGTLDPFATGLLIILIGREWTKQQERFLKLPKQYLARIRLGVETTTYDCTGDIMRDASRDAMSLSDTQLSAAFSQFRGTISQQVPPYAAVKTGGTPLYKRVRANAPLPDLPVREVTIFSLELEQVSRIDGAVFLDVRVDCSSGTYIRSIAHDYGRHLGVGGHLVELRRTAIGSYELAQAAFCPWFNRS